jgi:hypothetical protein
MRTIPTPLTLVEGENDGPFEPGDMFMIGVRVLDDMSWVVDRRDGVIYLDPSVAGDPAQAAGALADAWKALANRNRPSLQLVS